MAEQGDKYKFHFILAGRAESKTFIRPRGSFSEPEVPQRDPGQHGGMLRAQFESIAPRFDMARDAQREAGVGEGFGLRLTFESFPDVALAFEKLAMEPSGIELLNVQTIGGHTFATVFVPDGKLDRLVNKLQKYLDESQNGENGAKNHALWDTVAAIRETALEYLWTDDQEVFPTSDAEAIWWEVWLPVRKNRQGVVDEFSRLARQQGFRVAVGVLTFPERTVMLVYGTVAQMRASLLVLNSVAALRRAKETAEFFDALAPEEQPEWIEDLLARLRVPPQTADVPYVCLLDTGVNHGHPLLQPALHGDDVHTVQPAWGAHDADGHGTNMAGLALVGDLTPILASTEPVEVGHRLESVKLLPHNGANQGTADHHGYLTVEAVARPEVTAPGRARVFGMAVMSEDHRDRGRPSAWSSAIDGLAADAEEEGNHPRLFVVSAGNTAREAWGDYPQSNMADGIHDPGQSWNALTVGALTHLVRITEEGTDGYHALAPKDSLSPHSTTSFEWDKEWPLKPDVLFEGGNVARDLLGTNLTTQSLQLLTTNANVADRLLDLANATSAASALASRMVAQLMGAYPDLWPESIRGLMVHSAEWTKAMQAMFVPNGSKTKKDVVDLVRCCGFGEPDLARAMWSADNSLTMICEDHLQPFQRVGSSTPKLNEMNVHQLPWPLAELEALGETEVEMRVTLSYFIEPNPSQRGVKSRYRYESHGLRFDVKRAMETAEQFRARINADARDEDYESEGNSDIRWRIGTQGRHRGSIHSDIWTGSAADLAQQGEIAVYPVSGWWKTRYALKCYDRSARYSLIVSIRAPEVEIDLYSIVASKIKPLVVVQT